MFAMCLDRSVRQKQFSFDWNLMADCTKVTLEVGCSQCVWIGAGVKNNFHLIGIG